MIIDKRTSRFCLLLSSTLLLAACDLPFLNDEEAKIEAKRQAEGMAVGSGCRYSSRALEECYGMNPKMSKAAILNGWREMDAYMRENNIVVAGPQPAEAPKKDEAGEAKPSGAAAPDQEPAKAAEAAPPTAGPAPKRTQGRPAAEVRAPRKNMV